MNTDTRPASRGSRGELERCGVESSSPTLSSDCTGPVGCWAGEEVRAWPAEGAGVRDGIGTRVPDQVGDSAAADWSRDGRLVRVAGDPEAATKSLPGKVATPGLEERLEAVELLGVGGAERLSVTAF